MAQPTRRTFLAMTATPLASCLVPETLVAATTPRTAVQVAWVEGSDGWTAGDARRVALLESALIPGERLRAPGMAPAMATRPAHVRLSVFPVEDPRLGPVDRPVTVELLSRVHGVPFIVCHTSPGPLRTQATAPTSLTAPVHAEHGVELRFTVEGQEPATVALGGDLPLAAGAWLVAVRQRERLWTVAILVEAIEVEQAGAVA